MTVSRSEIPDTTLTLSTNVWLFVRIFVRCRFRHHLGKAVVIYSRNKILVQSCLDSDSFNSSLVVFPCKFGEVEVSKDPNW